jgi:hypothetical protein
VRRALVLAIVAAALAAPAPAEAADCVTYPGDDAPQQTLAQWLAYGATLRSIPGELPVMAALVESGVRILPAGQSDSVGFFQMQIGIWNQGEYAGFPTNPPLQLKWFIDQAIAVRAARLVADAGYGTTEDRWGEWVADVERPAQQFRYRYQLRLQESRGLIAGGCVPDGALTPPATPPPRALDLAAPEPRLGRVRSLRRLRGLTLRVTCPSESCAVSAVARISVPAAARVYRLRSRPRSLAAGESAPLPLHFGRRLRAALVRHKRRGRHASARLTVTAGDAAGNTASERQRVRLF